MHIEVPSLPAQVLQSQRDSNEESSAQVRARVIAAREKQQTRGNTTNALLVNKQVEHYCALEGNDRRLLEQSIDKLGLSARAIQRILKIARTIADLDQASSITTQHLTEAIGYRRLDRCMV